MTTTILQEDIDKATIHYREHGAICDGCVVFQAAKRNGIPIADVFANEISLENGKFFPLAQDAQEVTGLVPSAWPSTLGKKITLPDL